MTARGGFPERFLNLCARSGIPYWDVCCTDGVIFARTTPEGYRKMRACAKKSGMKIRITKKCGLPFFVFANRLHAGLAIGAVCFALIISVLSGKVWTVRVSGCEKLSQEDIIAAVSELGVRPGVSRKKLNVNVVCDEVMSRIPQVSWISINLNGCAANIEIRESVGEAAEPDDKPCDLIAASDGQIQTMEIFSGTAIQQQNAAVLKGDLLISGIVENRDGGISTRHAAGYVTAVTRHVLKTESQRLPTRRISKISSRYTLIFFSLKIPLGKAISADFTEERYLKLGDITLPIGISTQRKYVLAAGDESSEELSALSGLDSHFKSETNEFENMQIMSRTTTERQSDGKTVFAGEYNCLENIGEERALELSMEQ